MITSKTTDGFNAFEGFLSITDTLSSPNTALRVDNSGQDGMLCASGSASLITNNVERITVTDTETTFTTDVYLPTSGGTPSPLNFYEEYTHSSAFAFGVGGSGSIASVDFFLTRIGRLVVCYIPQIQGIPTGAPTTIDMATVLPARFRPGNQFYAWALGKDDTTLSTLSRLSFATSGALQIRKDPAGFATYTATKSCGIFTASTCWYV